MDYQNKGHPIERRDYVFDFMAQMLCIITFLTIGSEVLRIIWVLYFNIYETAQVTLFMINKKIDLNI